MAPRSDHKPNVEPIVGAQRTSKHITIDFTECVADQQTVGKPQRIAVRESFNEPLTIAERESEFQPKRLPFGVSVALTERVGLR